MAALILQRKQFADTGMRAVFIDDIFKSIILSKIRAGFSDFIRNPADKKTKVRETQPFTQPLHARAGFISTDEKHSYEKERAALWAKNAFSNAFFGLKSKIYYGDTDNQP